MGGVSWKNGNHVWDTTRGVPGHRFHFKPKLVDCEWMCSMIGDDCGCITYYKSGHCLITRNCEVENGKVGSRYGTPSLGVWRATRKHPEKPLNCSLKATGAANQLGSGKSRVDDCGPLGKHCAGQEY